VFNSRVAIAPKNDLANSQNTEQPKVITPKAVKPRTKRSKPTIGNPGIDLVKNHPATIIEARRKYSSAPEYIKLRTARGLSPSPLAISALGLAQSEDGSWNGNGTPDERLYGQNLTKYNDTKLVPTTPEDESLSPISQSKKRSNRLLNKGYANRDHVTFGTLIRDPYFKVDMSEDDDGSNRIPIGRDQTSGKLAHPLVDLTAHHFDTQKDLLGTIDGIEKGAFPEDSSTTPNITNVTGAINRGLRGYARKRNNALFVDPAGKPTSFFKGFTTLANNIKTMTKPYDRTNVQPPTQDDLFKAKKLVREQKPEFFDEKGHYVDSDIASQVNDMVSRYVVDKNKKTQLKQHQDEHNGLTRALKNVAVCPCPHCQISHYENPLATVLDSSLHREVKTSDDEELKNVFKKDFGFYNPHAIMIQDPTTLYTREDGKKGGGHPHKLATNMIQQVLHNRLKLRN
jgi:hypothetical protein